MAEKNVKKKRKKPFSNLITLVLCAAIIALAFTIISQQATISKLSAESDNLKQKIAEQEQEKVKIEEQLEAPNELERVEQIAREQLGMLKPGERVFVDSSR